MVKLKINILIFTKSTIRQPRAYPGFYNGGSSQEVHPGIFQKAAKPGDPGKEVPPVGSSGKVP